MSPNGSLPGLWVSPGEKPKHDDKISGHRAKLIGSDGCFRFGRVSTRTGYNDPRVTSDDGNLLRLDWVQRQLWGCRLCLLLVPDCLGSPQAAAAWYLITKVRATLTYVTAPSFHPIVHPSATRDSRLPGGSLSQHRQCLNGKCSSCQINGLGPNWLSVGAYWYFRQMLNGAEKNRLPLNFSAASFNAEFNQFSAF